MEGVIAQIIQELARQFVDLLTKKLGGNSDHSQLSNRQPDQFYKIIAHNPSPEQLLRIAKSEAHKHDLIMANRLFREADERAQKSNKDKTRFNLYVLWSTIKCAYVIRGELGAEILCEAGKKIDPQLEKIENTNDPSVNIIAGYLYYLRGLTYGLNFTKDGRPRRTLDSLKKEIDAYKKALELFGSLESEPKWADNYRIAIQNRMDRVRQTPASSFVL